MTVQLTTQLLRQAAQEASDYLDSLLPSEDSFSHTYSPQWEWKLQALIQKQRRRERRQRLWKMSRRIAAVLLAFLLMIPVFNPSARAALQALIVQVQEYVCWTEYSFELQDPPKAHTLVEAELTYIPSWMELNEDDCYGPEYDEEFNLTYVQRSYRSTKSLDVSSFSIVQKLLSEDADVVYQQPPHAEMKYITIHGQTAMLCWEYVPIADITNIDIVWQEGDYLFTIRGVGISEKELTRIAKGVSLPG